MQEREILFRGKRVDTGEWVEGYLLQSNLIVPVGQFFNFCKCNDKNIITSDSCFVFYEIDQKTRGEYTGLTDKNGVKIFEGDILYDEYNECNCLVTFDEGSFCFVDDNVCQSVWGCSMAGFEVIGNIHDNPELIKE